MQVIAHRGASHTAPENTFAAFEIALAEGAHGIETDVQASKDGVLFLMHDRRLDRTTNGRGRLRDYTSKELRELDAGVWKEPRYRGQRVPLLSEFLERYAGKLPLVLELKDSATAVLLPELLGEVREGANITFTSFELPYLRALKARLPRAYCGYLARSWPIRLAPVLREIGIQQICPKVTELKPADVSAWHDEGFNVRAWAVKSDEFVLRCGALSVDGFTVDFPGRAIELLGLERFLPTQDAG